MAELIRLRERHESRGQTLVEFALILPIFLLLVFGILDMGRAVLAFNSISNGAREGARTAIVNQSSADIRTRIVRASSGVAIDGATDVRIAFRESSNPNNVANVCRDSSGAQAPRVDCVAVVNVRSRFQPATPVIGAIIGSICLQSTTMMPIEAVPSPPAAPPAAWTPPCP